MYVLITKNITGCIIIRILDNKFNEYFANFMSLQNLVNLKNELDSYTYE